MSEILERKQVWSRKRTGDPRPGRLRPDEQENVRRALQFLMGRYGSRAALAQALRVSPVALERVKSPGRKPGMRYAQAVALVAGVVVEEVITGRWPKRCPTCAQVLY